MAQENVESNTSTAEIRLAKNYRLVNEILREQDRGTHLSVADLYVLAKERRPGIGFTTVYRALARLRELGLVSEILLPGADNAYYETAGSSHAHFRCERCGRIDDVDFDLTPALAQELVRRQGAHVTDVSLTLHGVCARCRDRAG
jgi:Fur family transcriptional regulator, ferric uptake regulator